MIELSGDDVAELRGIASRLGMPVVEISVYDRAYLTLGVFKSTADQPGYWAEVRDGKIRRIDFTYLERRVVASGSTRELFMASAREYERLSGMTMMDYLVELGLISES